MQIVAGLVASRTAMVSTLLGSLVKLWVQRSCKDISPSVKKFDKEGYNLDQIFNFDETSLLEANGLKGLYLEGEIIRSGV